MRDSRLEELISAYLDDEVTAEERAKVEQFLRESSEARRALDDFRGLQTQLRSLRGNRLRPDFCHAILADPRVVARAAERQRSAQLSTHRADPASVGIRLQTRALKVIVGLTVALVAVVALFFYPRPRSVPIAVRPPVASSETADSESQGERERPETRSSVQTDSEDATTANLNQSKSLASSVGEPNRAILADTKSGPSVPSSDFVNPLEPRMVNTPPAAAPYVRKSVNFFDVAVTKAGQKARVLEGTFARAGLRFEPRAAAEPPHQEWESDFLKSRFARETVTPAAELTSEPFDDVMLLYGHGSGHQNDLIAAALESEPEIAVRRQFIWIAPEKVPTAADRVASLLDAEQLLSLDTTEDQQLLVSLGELTWNLATAISEEEPKPALYRISLSRGWHSRSKASLPEFKRSARIGENSSARAGFRSPASLAERAARGEQATRAAINVNQNQPEPLAENARPQEARNQTGGQPATRDIDCYQGTESAVGGGVIGGEIPIEFLFLIRHLRD